MTKKEDKTMEEQTERKKYEFYLEINSFKDHNLYLRKAGEENYIQNENGKTTDQQDSVSNKNSEETYGKKQHFEECWGFDNASDELKDFYAWKEYFFPTLLDKYNINKEDCKVIVKGPVEVHNFFKQEEYKDYFEMKGKPIVLLKDEDIEKFLLEYYGKKEMFPADDIRACYNNLITNLNEKLLDKEQEVKQKTLIIENNENQIQKLKNENPEIINQIKICKAVENEIIEKIKSIFDDKKISLKGKDKYLKDVKNRDDVKIHINYENKIEQEIKSLSIEPDLKQIFNTLSSKLSDKLKFSLDDSIEEKKVGLIKRIIKKIEFSFNETKFTESKKLILEKYRSQVKREITSYYDEKIKHLENTKKENESNITNYNDQNGQLKKVIEDLNQKIENIKEFLDKNNKLIESTKQNSEETEVNNNE